jgi:hypothetical protein
MLNKCTKPDVYLKISESLKLRCATWLNRDSLLLLMGLGAVLDYLPWYESATEYSNMRRRGGTA